MNIEPDESDETADKMLPCLRKDRFGDANCNNCGRCSARPVVAAKFREQAAIIATLHKTCEHYEDRLKKQAREIERLTAEWNKQFTLRCELIVEHDSLRAEIAGLRAANAEAEKRGMERAIKIVASIPADHHESAKTIYRILENLRAAMEAK